MYIFYTEKVLNFNSNFPQHHFRDFVKHDMELEMYKLHSHTIYGDYLTPIIRVTCQYVEKDEWESIHLVGKHINCAGQGNKTVIM